MAAGKWLSIAMIVFAWAAGPCSAQEQNLILTTMSPAGSANSTLLFGPWAARINEQGKGVIHIEPRDGPTLANFGNVYERVNDDVVQIGWLLPGLLGGQFGLTEVSGLPFMTDNAEQGSVALWRFYKSGALSAEYKDIVPLMFGVFPQFQLHFAKPVRSLETLRGLKVTATGKSSLQIIEKLGGSPESLPPQDIYEALERGTIDGVMMPWSAFDAYKLTEVTSYHVETALGTTPSVIFMSKKKYAQLSDAARKVLDDNSEEKGSRAFGSYLDRQVVKMREPSASAPAKHTIVQLSSAQTEQWRKDVNPIIEQWAQAHPNGEAVLGSYRTVLEQVKADLRSPGNSPQ
jgi:TRAP-type transport system periplasmic protein